MCPIHEVNCGKIIENYSFSTILEAEQIIIDAFLKQKIQRILLLFDNNIMPICQMQLIYKVSNIIAWLFFPVYFLHRSHVQRQAKIHVRSCVSTQFLILTGGGFGKWIESGFRREVCQAVSFHFSPALHQFHIDELGTNSNCMSSLNI